MATMMTDNKKRPQTIEECRAIISEITGHINDITFTLRKTGSIPEWQKLKTKRHVLEDEREKYTERLDELFASQADAQAADEEDRYQQDGQS